MSDMMKLVKELGAANAIKTVEISALRAENERLRNAGESIVEWWLADGVKHYNGAPSAMFALRRALGHIKE